MSDQNKNKEMIFIVEDDSFLLDMYVVKFSEKGYQVVTASGGEDALKKIEGKEIEPDIILLDLVMPGVDGFEVLEKVKKNKLLPEAVIVILSNLGQREDIERGKALGADGYIIKASATPTEVVNRVRDILSAKRLVR